MTAPQILTLKNILFIHGKEHELIRGNLMLGKHLTLGSTENSIDCTNYLAIPGFLNAGSEFITNESAQDFLSQGCTTIAALGDDEISGTIQFKNIWDSYTNGDLVIEKSSPYLYTLNGTKLSPIAGQGNHFASGTTNVDIWSYYQAQLMRLGDRDSMLENILSITLDNNQNGLKLFGKHAGVIDNGFESDLIIIKLEPFHSTQSAQEIMLNLVLQRKSIEGVFQSGKLVFGSEEFSAQVKQTTLSKYYINPNEPVLNDNDEHVFDSIESALEDFSTEFNRKWQFCSSS